MPNEYFSTGEVARHFHLPPRAVIRLFYDGFPGSDDAPLLCGRRAVPSSLLPVIASELRRRGHTVREVSHAKSHHLDEGDARA